MGSKTTGLKNMISKEIVSYKKKCDRNPAPK